MNCSISLCSKEGNKVDLLLSKQWILQKRSDWCDKLVDLPKEISKAITLDCSTLTYHHYT